MNRRLYIPMLQSVLIVACVTCCACAQVVYPSDTTDKWDQSFTLYGWIPAQNGDVVVRGNPASIDTSISDALDALSSLDGAFLGHYEDRNGRGTLIADLFYVRLKDTVQTQTAPLGFESAQTIAELAWAYLINAKPTGQAVDILGGLRYSAMRLRLSDATGLSAVGDQAWVDPFIGGRFRSPLSDRWMFRARADIGGFGIGDASDFTWNLILGFEYSLSERSVLGLGWRWLDYNYDTGSGEDRFEYDVLMQGPLIGYTYKF